MESHFLHWNPISKPEKIKRQRRLILEIKSSDISKERSLALTEKCVEMVQKIKRGFHHRIHCI